MMTLWSNLYENKEEGTMNKSNTVILARVSSKSQEDEGYSLDSQLKLLNNYCQNKDLKVIKIFKIAETASKQQGRKIFRELLTYISKNDVCHLTVEKTDRLTRNLRDAVSIDDWLDRDENRMLHAVKEGLMLHKSSKSDVKFMWNIHLAVAKKYTDNLREEAMKGWAEKLAQGWLPAVPPPGYITVTRNGKRVHIINKVTKNLVRKAFIKYLEPNHSIATITDYMEEVGLVSRNGRPFTRSHVHKCLTNPFYIGVNRFDGKDYPGAQEPLISKKLFDDVQNKMHDKQPILRAKHNPVFKNMIQCENCNGTFTWEKHKGKYYGSCQRKQATCKGKKFIREDRVETLIADMLSKLVCPSHEIIEWTSTAIRDESKADTRSLEESTALIKSKIGRVEHMDEDLYDDKLAGEITKERYAIKHEQFAKDKAGLADQLSKLVELQISGFEHGLTVLELSQKAARIYSDKASPDQKRIILTELFNKLTANGETLSVKYTKFANIIAEKTTETTQLLLARKSTNRTFEKTLNYRGSEGNYEMISLLRPIWQGRQDLNLRHLVLETSALPTELRPYAHIYYEKFVINTI